MTKSMSCSTSSTLTPSALQLAQQLGQRLLLAVAQAGRRFVEQQQRRDRREARAISRMRSCPSARLPAQARACAPSPTRSICRAPRRAARAPPRDRAGELPAARRPMPRRWAPSGDVLEHGHVRPQMDVLEGAGDAARGDVARWQAGRSLAAELDLAARQRQHAGDQVEDRALAGAVRADQADDLARPDLEADLVDRDQAAEPLARLVDLEQHVAGAPDVRARAAAPRRRRARMSRAGAREQRPQAVARELQEQHQEDAEHDRLELAAWPMMRGSTSCSWSLRSVTGRAEDRAPDMAGAAEHGHQQILDARR